MPPAENGAPSEVQARLGEAGEDTLPCCVLGKADGPAILFVHPLGADLSFWAAVQDALKDDYFTIACSLRGARGSLPARQSVTLQQTAEDIEAVRRRLGLMEMVVSGCAVGAMAAATYAALYPQHVTALILSNPAIEITPAASDNLRSRAALVRSGGMKALLPAAIDRAFDGCGEGPLRDAYEQDFLAQPPEGYAMAALGACDSNLKPILATLAMPVLLIAGGRDLLLPQAQARLLQSHLPQAELVVIDEGAHFIPYQQAAAFTLHVRNFLERSSEKA